MPTSDLQGYARLSSGLIDLSTARKAVISPQNELLVAQGMPPYTEMQRKGNHWGTMATAAVAALVVRPSTTAAFEIHNGYTNGMNLVIDRIFTHELVSSTTGLGGGATIYAMVTNPKEPPADGSFAINSLSGKSVQAYKPGGITSVGKVTAAAGTTVVDNGWFPWGLPIKKESAGAVVPAGAITVEVAGRLIVPPRCSLCLHVVSGYAADTFTSGADWYEEIFALN